MTEEPSAFLNYGFILMTNSPDIGSKAASPVFKIVTWFSAIVIKLTDGEANITGNFFGVSS